MPATVDHYDQVAATFPDTESLTVLTVAGATRHQVVAQLEIDLGTEVEEAWRDDEEKTAWAIRQIPGSLPSRPPSSATARRQTSDATAPRSGRLPSR